MGVLDLPVINPFLPFTPRKWTFRLCHSNVCYGPKADSLSHVMVLCREGMSDSQAKQPIERSDSQEQQTVEYILRRHLVISKIDCRSNQNDREKTSCPLQNIA
jgi:hypothetical protein